MKEIYRTTNPAEIALLKSVFAAEGIELFLFDELASGLGVMDGAYAPCRFMVLDGEYEEACGVLKECELEPTA